MDEFELAELIYDASNQEIPHDYFTHTLKTNVIEIKDLEGRKFRVVIEEI